MPSPSGSAASIDDDRAGDDERDPGGPRGEREAVGPDLVGDVAVGRDAVGPGDHGVGLAAADQPGGGAVDDELVRHAGARELPRRQPRALQQRPGLAREDADLVGRAAVQLEDDGERRAGAARGERAGVADRQDAPRAGQQIGAVAGDRRARGVLLGVDPLGLGARGAGHRDRPGGQGGGADALDGPREVHGGRPRAGEELGAVLERAEAGPPRDLHGQAVGGDHPDQRRAADGEAADRGGGVLGAGQRQPRLARGERVWSRTDSARPSQRSATAGSAATAMAAMLRARGRRPGRSSASPGGSRCPAGPSAGSAARPARGPRPRAARRRAPRRARRTRTSR